MLDPPVSDIGLKIKWLRSELPLIWVSSVITVEFLKEFLSENDLKYLRITIFLQK